jgi:hypothetical protein
LSLRHDIHFDIDPGFGSILFEHRHRILLPNTFGIAHVAAHFNAIGEAGLGQQFFGACNVLLERGQGKVFGVYLGDMVVFGNDP